MGAIYSTPSVSGTCPWCHWWWNVSNCNYDNSKTARTSSNEAFGLCLRRNPLEGGICEATPILGVHPQAFL